MANYLWYFFIYSFLGWCSEVVFSAVSKGGFTNRGFLNGPVCPIYGFGLTIVLIVLEPLKDNFFILYIGSVLLTTALELVTGFLMEKVFHHRWWDYSTRPLNIGGYVCALFSLVWGFACVVIVDVLHPVIAGVVSLIPATLGTICLVALCLAFTSDLVATVITVAKLNLRLTQIEETSHALRKFSDAIGSNMAEGAIDLAEKNRERSVELREKGDELRAKGEELHARYEALLAELPAGQKRLLRAFPDLHSVLHSDTLEELKARYTTFKDKKTEEKQP